MAKVFQFSLLKRCKIMSLLKYRMERSSSELETLSNSYRCASMSINALKIKSYHHYGKISMNRARP